MTDETNSYTVKKTPGRKVTPEQLKQLVALAKQLDAAEAEYEGAYGLKPRGIDEKFFKNKLKGQNVYFASDADGKGIVGMALSSPPDRGAYYKNTDYINMLSVDSEHRGRGIGRRLLRAAILDSIRKHRMPMLSVNANNPAGLHLYESEGFTPLSHTMIYQGEKKAEAPDFSVNPLVNQGDLDIKRTIGAVVRDRRNRILTLGHNKFDMLTIPVGKAEPGESDRSAARRELLEEVNIRAKRLKLLKQFYRTFEPLPGQMVRKRVSVFDVPEWEGTPTNLEPAKHSFMRFMSKKQIKDMSRRTGKQIGVATGAVLGEKAAEDYTVTAGDTLSGISKRTGIPVQTIAKSNGIANPDRIRVGQQLAIPAVQQPQPVKQPVQPVQSTPQQHDLSTREGRINYTSDFLHRKFNNRNLEAAWLANINHETGGTFDPNTKEKGGTGYGMLQYTGASRKAYDTWLAKQKYGTDTKGMMDAQLEYGTGQYMKSRPGYRKYTAPGAAFTRGQYADWIHRSVLTPAHVIKGNPHYSEAATARRNVAQQQFMDKGIRLVNGQWRAAGL